jgi:hypothetical protein
MSEKKQIPSWLKPAVGCGCAVFVGLCVFLASASFLAFRVAKESFMVDPVRIQQLADRTYSGNRVPQGFTPTFGMDISKMQIVGYQGTAGRGLMLIAINLPDHQLTRSEIVTQLDQTSVQNGKSGRHKTGPKKVITQQEISVECSGKGIPGFKRLVEQNGSKIWEYVVIGKSSAEPNRALAVVGVAPENSPDETFWRDYTKSLAIEAIQH